MTGTDLAGRASDYMECARARHPCACAGIARALTVNPKETFGEIPGTKWLQSMESYSCGEEIDNSNRMRSSDDTRSGLLLCPVSG